MKIRNILFGTTQANNVLLFTLLLYCTTHRKTVLVDGYGFTTLVHHPNPTRSLISSHQTKIKRHVLKNHDVLYHRHRHHEYGFKLHQQMNNHDDTTSSSNSNKVPFQYDASETNNNMNKLNAVRNNNPKPSSSTQRKISHIEKFARLPVWPAWNGALLFLLSKILANNLIAKLEDQFGGRVCPNFFPDNGSKTSPFIMLVHHVHSFTLFDPIRLFQKKVILPEGFPSHPHRGFITLTYCLRGGMVHRDSIACKQTYGNEKRHGGNFAQWLITGAGLLHEEMWDINYDQDGICSQQELYQLWINVPSTCKMDSPAVYLLSDEEEERQGHTSTTTNDDEDGGDLKTEYAFSPTVQSENGDVETKILVGEYNGHSSSNSVPLESSMSILHVTIKPNASWSMRDIPSSYRTAIIYMRKGSIRISPSSSQERVGAEDNDIHSNEIPAHHTAYLTPYGDEIAAKAGEDGGDFLLLTGEPINEPMQARGSMVMNTFDEIDQAYNDYSRGLMGTPWDQDLSDDEWREHVNKFPSVYH